MKREDIDLIKWDKTIASAFNSRIYGLSWYLDIVCKDGWIALIYGDYEAVFPIPLNHRIPLLPRISLPLYAQQLGVFSKVEIRQDMMQSFITAIPKKYRSVYLQLNSDNKKVEISNGTWKKRTNLVIELNKPYEVLRKSYSRSLKRNIKKAQNNNLELLELKPNEFIQFYEVHSNDDFMKHLNTSDVLSKLISKMFSLGCGKVYGVKNKSGEIIAAYLMSKFEKRITYLMARSNQDGKFNSAMHFIIDQTIIMHSNSHFIFDFEGSDIDNIATFFKSFGAIEQPYYALYYKHFPFILFSSH